MDFMNSTPKQRKEKMQKALDNHSSARDIENKEIFNYMFGTFSVYTSFTM